MLEAAALSEGIALIETHANNIRLLLTDIRLGDGPDGWDVAHFARSQLAELPIVFVSTDSVENWREAGFERRRMLGKPVRDGDLLAAVRAGVEGSEQSPSNLTD